MFTFIIKLSKAKHAKVMEFIGTWNQLEDKYPKALILYTPVPTED